MRAARHQDDEPAPLEPSDRASHGRACRLVGPLTDRLPVEVLPVEAVAQDGPESYVFELNDGHFDRRAVHVEYRDQESVVIVNDGALRLGATVAVTSAHQMQLSLKIKAGGGVDPHAGHNH